MKPDLPLGRTAFPSGPEQRVWGKLHWFKRLLWLTLLGALLIWALKSAPFREIGATLMQLEWWEVAGLLVLNALIILLTAARWWIIIRAEDGRVPFQRLAVYRLAAFGVSYFTPGPQVGGEPLQVVYLQKGHGLSYARATAVVIMDKLLEFIANFIFLAAGTIAVVKLGILVRNSIPLTGSVVPLAAVLSMPALYAGLLYLGYYPLGASLRAVLPRAAGSAFPRLLLVSERMAAAFTRRHPGAMLIALGVSLVGWAGMTVEYWLMAHFLGIQLTGWQALAGVSVALISFLLPLPAGLGALEASQVLALGAMGFSPIAALSLALLVRARDMFFGGLGLLLVSRGLRAE